MKCKKSIIRFVIPVLFAMLALLLSACGSNSDEIHVECLPGTGEVVEKAYNFPTEVFKGTPDPDSTLLKVATHSNNGIDIYGTYEYEENRYSLIVMWEGCSRQFDISYLGTGGVDLQSSVLDVDHDGKDELVLIEHLGSGTGVSVDALHVIEKTENALSVYSLCNDEFSQKMQEWISNQIDLKTRKINLGATSIKIPNYVDISRFAFRNMVSFAVVDSQIYITLDIQFWPADRSFNGISEYTIELVADVAFFDQTFTLRGFKASEQNML